jgi:hypothetical protein
MRSVTGRVKTACITAQTLGADSVILSMIAFTGVAAAQSILPGNAAAS